MMLVKWRRDTDANWTSINPVLMQGELGVNTTNGRIKIGDGTSTWSVLTYQDTAGPSQTKVSRSYGDGSDGTVTISSGTTVLTRDMYYQNLTISGTGSLNPNGYRIFVNGVLDLSQAPSGAIDASGINGGNASGSTGGTAPTAPVPQSIGVGGGASNGITGTSAAGTTGVAGAAITGNGGQAGASGAGGAGTNIGGVSIAASPPTSPLIFRRWETSLIRGITLLMGGKGGGSGGSGGGDSTNAGGGSGSGGNGGGVIALYARIIYRGSAGQNTNAGVIRANGGMGGNGGNGTAGNTGGGGGASGAGGGWIFLVYETLSGSAITNGLQAFGGTGGNGGNGVGTGIGGAGGGGGNGGTIVRFQSTTASVASIDINTVGMLGNAVVGSIGGDGGLGAVLQRNL